MTATALAVAFIFFSCDRKVTDTGRLDLLKTPLQTIDSMFIVQTTNGGLQFRVEAELMERYVTDTTVYEKFPKGVELYGYNEEGLMETMILADDALHEQKNKGKVETWSAFGNVVIQNILKRETMETDTIYWDRVKGEIYTDCYVKLYSPDGFIQGVGMKSDEMARNSIIYKPFDSFGIVGRDTTAVVIDSVNFIGPFLKK